MTGSHGDRSHGFCRRVYIGNSIKKLPIVFCIISTELWSLLYYKALEVMEQFITQDKLLRGNLVNQLPSNSISAQFLANLYDGLKKESQNPGAIMKVHLPSYPKPFTIDPVQKILTLGYSCPDLKWCAILSMNFYSVCFSGVDFIEFQIPPLTGVGTKMSAVSLARLLWRIPVQCLMTLFASLLLERRIIMVSRSKDTLSASVHAAAALIYPFEWSHRFYLPIMPETLRDYLQAPMPFLVGLPAELMDFKGLQMDEVTLIDLDLGTCSPKPGSDADDVHFLPMKERLQSDFHEAVKALRSPTEFEGNHRIADCVIGYMVKIFKNYRDFLSHNKESLKKKTRTLALNRLQSRKINHEDRHPDDAFIFGHGLVFDHDGFVASHKKKEERLFLNAFRQSQMYEVFIQQRLEMASHKYFPKNDPFESRISLIRQHKSSRVGKLHHCLTRKYSMGLTRQISTSIKLRHTCSFVGTAHSSQSDKGHTHGIKPQPNLFHRDWSNKDSPGFEESHEKSIKVLIKEMAEESAKENAKSLEPGNYLKVSRASFKEDIAESTTPIQDSPHGAITNERSISWDEKTEPEDEFDGFPTLESPEVAPSMSSMDFDPFDHVTPFRLELEEHENNNNTKAEIKSESQLTDKVKLVADQINSKNGKQIKNEKIPRAMRNDTTMKMEKMVEDCLNRLSMKSPKTSSGLPPKPIKSSTTKQHPTFSRTLAFSHGPHDI
eukprot:g7371.t1